MKKDYRNKGFTLVEMIVVIVIIGILLAILVPGMFRYIQKAKEQQAIVECRAVVTAAQTLALEQYGKNIFEPENFQTDSIKLDICNNAGVTGSIVSGVLFSDMPNHEIKYLEYESAGDILVIYDISSSSVFFIKYNRTETYKDKIDYVTKKFNSNHTGNDEKSYKKTREDFFNSDYAQLSTKEKELWKNFNLPGSSSNYKWKPCIYNDADGNTQFYFIATQAVQGNDTTPMVLYNNEYYIWKGQGNSFTTKWLKDTFGDPSFDSSTYTTKDNLKNVKDEWIKVVN